MTATPAQYDRVYVDSSHYVEEPPPDNDQVIGYEKLSNGEQVEVVTYVHTYPEPIETYPRVYWSGSWYYNVNGDFIYWSDYYGGWVYYAGPPFALVHAWNFYYPWCPYYWGAGYYGPGWYWGGVGVYGYHAYGIPVTHHHHHHHHHNQQPNQRPTKNARRPDRGGSPAQPSTQPPRQPTDGAPQRQPVVTNKQVTAGQRQPGPAKVANPNANSNAGFKAPTRDGGGSPGVAKFKTPAGTPAQVKTAPPPAQVKTPSAAPVRTRYVTSGGQTVTTIRPVQARPPAKSLGTVPSRGFRRRGNAPPSKAQAPSYRPATAKAWGGRSGTATPTKFSAPRSNGSPGSRPAPSRTQAPNRGTSPSRSPSRGYAPSRSPSRAPSSAPSRGFSPSRSPAPSRAPSRSYSPSRSSSPSRAAPSRAPSRAAPSRAPSRSSSPARSAPSRARPRASSSSSSRSRASSSRSSGRSPSRSVSRKRK